MTIVRLLADDLTGALDTAAEFVPLAGTLPVQWPNGGATPEGSVALDSQTRELGADAAMATVARMIGYLGCADIAFKKIDSLLRGPTLPEIVACAQAGTWRHCVLAPAFPYHQRITQAGRQYISRSGTWTATSGDLAAGLHALGLTAQRGETAADLQPGVSVFDAETDEDLRRIVLHAQRCPDPVLWIGTGGLAQALAAGRDHPALLPLPRPILGVFGSDQPTTAGQLAACHPHWLEIEHKEYDSVAGWLSRTGVALVSFRLPTATPRGAAAERIAAIIAGLVNHIAPPGSVVVAGGETLRTVCSAVGATSLLVQGRLVPGVPRSVIQGGRWHGVTVVSKSGAFGHPSLLRELIL